MSAALRIASLRNKLKGVRVNKHAPLVNHLFSDDSLIFGEATIETLRTIKNLLNRYVDGSGQLINFDKSGSFFSSNVNSELKDQICHILGVNSSSNPERYLELPSVVGQNNRRTFNYLKEKMVK